MNEYVRAGYVAFNSFELDKNPYQDSESQEHKLWKMGWLSAQKDYANHGGPPVDLETLTPGQIVKVFGPEEQRVAGVIFPAEVYDAIVLPNGQLYCWLIGKTVQGKVYG